ncbi:MAG: carboxypeptidase regulatory-like domain-containing protein [Betaproteobacteria bacterium]
MVTPPAPAATGRAAITGTTVTSRCAVEPDTGCPTVPVRSHVALVDRAGVTTSTMDTDAAGRFTFAVKPGVYTVRATSLSGSLPGPGSVVVTVHADQVATVTIMMDSGIRCCQPPGPT